MNISNICVLGGGAWGTALACSLAYSNHNVILWVRDADTADKMNNQRVNYKYLPNVNLPNNITVTADTTKICNSDLILVAVPAQENRRVLSDLSDKIPAGTPLVLCAKGIEYTTNSLMYEVAASCIQGSPLFILTGPGFAIDLANRMPIALTLAGSSTQDALLKEIQNTMHSSRLRIYISHDIISCQIGGAMKNIYAIACGAVHGMGLGSSSQASLMTRGFYEMSLIARAKGGSLEAISGLSGVGDLVLSSHSKQSRNFMLGYTIATKGYDSHIGTGVCEGEKTTHAILSVSEQLGIELPVCKMTQQFLENKLDKENSINILMERPLKHEF